MGFHRHIVRTCTIHIRARKSSEEIDLSTVTRTTYDQDTKMESSKFSKNMSASRHNVHLLLVACSAFMFLMLSSMLPQTRAVLSGTGGVFDSPAAQEYWARRFGSGQLDAARSAAQKFIDQESSKIAEPFSRQAKVQQIDTILPNANIPSFTGSLYRPRSPFWLRRF